MDSGYYDFFDDYGFASPEIANFMLAFLGVFAVVLIAASAVALALYILRSIGLMTIARNRGLRCPWITWIPIVGGYTLGEIADDINAVEGHHSIYRFLLPGGSLLSLLASGRFSSFNVHSILSGMRGNYGSLFAAGGFSALVSLAVFVASVIALRLIYRCYKPESATAFTVLNIFFPLLQSVFPFVIRNNRPNWINPPYTGGDWETAGQDTYGSSQNYYEPTRRRRDNPYYADACEDANRAAPDSSFRSNLDKENDNLPPGAF